MDDFCIERGTLFDNQDLVTLENPDQHSVHCLVDVQSCVTSPWEILSDPMMGGDMMTYGRTIRVDGESRDKLVDVAKDASSTTANPPCTECTGDGTLGRGLRTTVRGRLLNVGVPGTGVPPQVDLTTARVSTGADDAFCHLTDLPLNLAPPSLPFERVLEDGKVVLRFIVDEVAGVLYGEFVYEGNAWLSIGFSEDGKMIGYTAVVGEPDRPTESTVNPSYYALDFPVFRLANESQTLIASDLVQNETHTVMTFTKLLVEDGHVPIEGYSNIFIYAHGGDNNAFGPHAVTDRGSVTIEGMLSEAEPPMLKVGDEVCVEGFGK